MPTLASRFLFLVIVLLAIAVAVLAHALFGMKPPYVIGTPVAPATMLPKGMVLKTYDVPADAPQPAVSFTVERDSMGGWDVHASTTNFAITPERLNGAAAPGEGHLHLYIDDHLIIMLGDWYHIDSLAPGDHTIRVGLFNNDHTAYAIGGKRVEAEQVVHVPAKGSAAEDSMPGMSM
jgi:hypothetical protein